MQNKSTNHSIIKHNTLMSNIACVYSAMKSITSKTRNQQAAFAKNQISNKQAKFNFMQIQVTVNITIKWENLVKYCVILPKQSR